MLSSQLKTSSLPKICVFLVTALSTGWAAATDFETVYRSALQNSTELSIVKAKAEEATALYDASSSKFMPRAGVESRFEAFDSEVEAPKGSTANAYVEWNVFNGFRDIQNRKGLNAESKAANLEKETVEFNFRWIAMSKYSRAQALQEAVEVYRKAIDFNRKSLESVRLRKASGRISDADVIEFELFDAKLKQDLIDAETAAAAALAELQAFSGIRELSKLTTELPLQPLNLDQLNIQDLLASGKARIQRNQLFVDAAEARRQAAAGGFWPAVNLKASHGRLGIRETPFASETAVAVTARWELFSGFESVNDRRVASAQHAKAKAEFENNRIQSLSRAEQLKNQLKSIQLRIDFEQKNQKQIDRYLTTIQQEYRRGVKSSNDLKSALELVLETQLNRARIRSSFFEARAELQEILGTELK